MFWHVIQSDILKMRKTNIWLLLFISPSLAFSTGLVTEKEQGIPNDWVFYLLIMTIAHSILFLPLIIGVFTSFVCRYEHQNGGWKQLLSLPVSRTHVYLSKFLIVTFLITINQLLFIVSLFIISLIKGFADPIPVDIILKTALGGLMASLPLIAFMLLISMAWSSFAAPLALNVIFTLPNIMVANSEKYAPFYPWVQPFLTMMPKDEGPWGGFFVSIESIIFPIIGGFILFFISGLLYIKKKAV
ncbi:ABC transporter permease [Metabacillus fastidiosus]|uniref:ABC transporter permease n=1 Tax=Metabacillus fastidiosus TaxID=1458 RepID=UPI003D2CD7B5